MIELKDAQISTLINGRIYTACGNGDSNGKLSFCAHEGKITAIRSQHGETITATLLAIMALWPLDGGCAAVDGELLTPLTRRVFRHRFAYIPREMAITEMSASEVTAVTNGEKKERKTKKRSKQAEAIAAALHIETAILQKPLKELSASQRRLALMAATLCEDKEYIVADQPTIDMDEESRDVVIACLKNLAAQGKTVVVGSDDSRMLAASDQIIGLNEILQTDKKVG